MIKLYTYIFYSVYTRYIQWGEDDVPEIYAIGVIVLLQGFLLMGAIDILSMLFSLSWEYGKFHALLFFVILFVLDHIIVFKNPGKNNILTFWSDQPKSKKHAMTLLMVLHFFVSIGLMVISIILRN